MDKTSKIILIILVVIILAIVIWYGIGKESVPEVEKPIKIGAILALTGDLGFVGEGMRNALEMAKDNALIEYGKKIEFVIQDDKSCSPTENVTIMNQFANVYKLRSVIGSTCSHSMLAITPVANNNKVILVSPSATIPEIRDEGEYIFRTCPADDLRAKVLANYVYDKIGKRAALLCENADAPIAFNELFKEIYESLGGEIVAEEINERGATDLRTQISKLKDKNPEVVLFTEYPQEAIIFLKQAEEIGIEATFVQGIEGVMESPEVKEAVGDLINDIIYLNPKEAASIESTKFKQDYEERFGTEPPIYAAEAYDAAMILIKCFNEDETLYRECVSDLENFYGASGVISFDEAGDVIKPLEIKTTEDLVHKTIEVIE